MWRLVKYCLCIRLFLCLFTSLVNFRNFSFVLVKDCAFKFCLVQTPVLEGFDVAVIRLSTKTVRGSLIFAVGCKTVCFNVGVALGCLVRSFSDVCSI